MDSVSSRRGHRNEPVAEAMLRSTVEWLATLCALHPLMPAPSAAHYGSGLPLKATWPLSSSLTSFGSQPVEWGKRQQASPRLL